MSPEPVNTFVALSSLPKDIIETPSPPRRFINTPKNENFNKSIEERRETDPPATNLKSNVTVRPANSEANNTKVAITAFVRSNCVYIRNGDDETTERYKLIHRVVDQLSQNLSPIEHLPEEGTFLIVNSKGFKRCIVQEVKSGANIKVFLSDFGRQEIVAMSRLFEPGSRLEKMAATSFIKMLNLENVPEFYMSKKVAQYAKSLLEDNVFLEAELGSQPDSGRIFDVIKNEFINDVLFCYAQDENPEMEEYEPEDKEFTFISDEIVKIDVSFLSCLLKLLVFLFFELTH